MEITSIKVNLRCSKDMSGAWKTIEVGAEATPASTETWKEEQDELYEELREQLLKFFGGNAS